ncbi:MAG: efflux RND transporter periplasmic adaptor subunit [Alphaproteobacteria bacterium]
MKNFIGIFSIIVAMVIVVLLTMMRPDPPKNQEVAKDIRVSVIEVTPQTVDDIITGHGQVNARWETTLSSEVQGRVIHVSDALLSGMTFNKGDVLVVVDPTSYQANLDSAKAALETAKRVLKEEQQRSKIASENWKTSGFSGKPTDLVLRNPQLREARAAIISAQSAVKKAEYDLAQTKIVAPYDGVVLERNINPSDILQVGGQVAKIYDRSIYDVSVPLNIKEVTRLRDGVVGSSAVLKAQSGNGTWEGIVSRLEQSIDNKNRWQNIIVEFSEQGSFLPGSFVTVQLHGKSYGNVYVLPEHFVGQDGMIWFVDEQERLQKFAADILFRENGNIYLLPPLDLRTPVHITPARDIYLAGVKVTPVLDAGGMDHE